MNERTSEKRDVDTRPATEAKRPREEQRNGLLPNEQSAMMRERWDDIQAGFVDDPRTAVARAEELVDNVVDELSSTFARERSKLESQWNTGDKVDTEQLRVALQRYRTFFNRLLGPEGDR